MTFALEYRNFLCPQQQQKRFAKHLLSVASNPGCKKEQKNYLWKGIESGTFSSIAIVKQLFYRKAAPLLSNSM